MTIETTTNTEYVLEGRRTEHYKTWDRICVPQKNKAACEKFRQQWKNIYYEFRIVEIVTTTTVARRVVE